MNTQQNEQSKRLKQIYDPEVQKSMEYCVPGVFAKKGGKKERNVSGTWENEQITQTKSHAGCMYFLLAQPQ